MKLDELKTYLDTEARIRVEKLEKENAQLREEKKSLLELVKWKGAQLDVLKHQLEQEREFYLSPYDHQ